MEQPIVYKRADWGLLFSFFSPPKNGQYFPTKKKKIAAARLATITATRWTGNRLFFVDSLVLHTCTSEKEINISGPFTSNYDSTGF